ncbi:mitochondrial antiviral-signaling protein [Phyllostomus hastatus]|uniref:mitochondrial antiviral-signaling protein n=1 Tax=Phyllostomus hastatus TaxID=9423 RepID=UPI001E6812E4|nr:mitochondrial antiviral-signaling protein [Phyllostomus hastatus]XP_045688808.1 mitochondrial antiviral-signaling protein [Phyllostomus hastatus]
MTVAEDKTYEYIRHHFHNFYHIHVLEILPYLSCLTASDQDLLRAHYNLKGNRNTIWELFNSLQRRNGWVVSLIRALRACELTSLADEVAHVYQSNLPLNQRCPPALLELLSASAEVPGPSAPAVAPSASHSSYRDEESSYPIPVQDTQSPASLGESSGKGPQTPSPDTVLRKPSGPQEPSSGMAALSPQPSSGLQEQDTVLGSTHTEVLPPAGTVSSLTSSPHGPVSPTVSFQPLARSTPRASRLPGPAVSALSTAAPSSSVGGAGGQAEATICSSGVGVPTNSMTTSTAPSKVPVHSAFTSTVPSNLPTLSKPPTNVPTSLPPSKLPVNTTRAGTAPPKVPTGLVPDHRMPTSSVPSKVPANKAPSIRSSNRPAEETPVSPVPTGAPAGGSSSSADRSSDSWDSGPELSKPGRLSSQDSQPFSGCSEDLAISCDSSGPKSNNAPEENEYSSVNGLSIHVAEGPSVDLMAGNPGLHAVPLHRAEEQETQTAGTPWDPWAPWLGAAAAGALLATLLAVLYRRRLLQ